ncbi:MAG: cellulase family glycosylhydrolase [Clostridia bacterium]|nr:cellulase family glycosylhydrolase [Clostridia bacterium]
MNNVVHTPYTLHGPLYVSGSELLDGNHLPFQLRGVSTHGIAWYSQYINAETFRYLRDNWHINCIRLAMYTSGDQGYQTGGNPAVLKKLIKKGIDIASSLGMYVIVDWHVLEDQDPMLYVDGATSFFNEISSKYGTYGNILYEICNEPNGSGT